MTSGSADDPRYTRAGSDRQPVLALAELPRLDGKVALVTGGTDGVGRALVDALAGAGATVLLTARDRAKGDTVRADVRAATGNEHVEVIDLDLASLDSVRSAADAVLAGWDRLDLVFCNAAHQSYGERSETADGFEMTFGVNHVGHFLLMTLLEPRLRASAPSAVVVVASEAHRRAGGGLDFDDLMLEREYERNLAYARSKLANIQFARQLAVRLDGTGVRVAAAHPGGVDTPMMSAAITANSMEDQYDAIRPFLITPADAAAGLLRVALDPELGDRSGLYFEHGTEVELGPEASDAAAAVRLWEVTEQLLSGAEGETAR